MSGIFQVTLKSDIKDHLKAITLSLIPFPNSILKLGVIITISIFQFYFMLNLPIPSFLVGILSWFHCPRKSSSLTSKIWLHESSFWAFISSYRFFPSEWVERMIFSISILSWCIISGNISTVFTHTPLHLHRVGCHASQSGELNHCALYNYLTSQDIYFDRHCQHGLKSRSARWQGFGNVLSDGFDTIPRILPCAERCLINAWGYSWLNNVSLDSQSHRMIELGVYLEIQIPAFSIFWRET